MDLTIVFLSAAAASAACGAIFADWRHRRSLSDSLEAERRSIGELVASLATTHNGLAQQLVTMQEQVNGLEFKVAGQKTQPRDNQAWNNRHQS